MSDFVSTVPVDELPSGERIVVEVNGKWVSIFNINGTYYAIEDLCTHDDGPLADGEIIGCEIECPRHGARFDLRNGAVTAPPALVPVPSYKVRVQSGMIEVATHPTKRSR